jgi:O-antigen/teichoic acid export membrane protein
MLAILAAATALAVPSSPNLDGAAIALAAGAFVASLAGFYLWFLRRWLSRGIRKGLVSADAAIALLGLVGMLIGPQAPSLLLTALALLAGLGVGLPDERRA